ELGRGERDLPAAGGRGAEVDPGERGGAGVAHHERLATGVVGVAGQVEAPVGRRRVERADARHHRAEVDLPGGAVGAGDVDLDRVLAGLDVGRRGGRDLDLGRAAAVDGDGVGT